MTGSHAHSTSAESYQPQPLVAEWLSPGWSGGISRFPLLVPLRDESFYVGKVKIDEDSV
jgi:hypothetical protein